MILPLLQLVHHLLSLNENSVDPRLFLQAQLALLDNGHCVLDDVWHQSLYPRHWRDGQKNACGASGRVRRGGLRVGQTRVHGTSG